jgi:aspartyl-tRNA synthetase
VAGHAIPTPFPRLSWTEAMERYGIDKPDLRYGIEIENLTPLVGDDAAPFIREGIAAGGRLRALRVPQGANASRKEIDGWAALAKDAKAGGLIWAKCTDHGWEGQGAKAFGATLLGAITGTPGDLLLAVVGPDAVASPALHAVRSAVIRRPGTPVLREHAFCWVVDFPLFEHDPETGAWVPAHHPFTAPHHEDMPYLESAPDRVRAQHYDAVYNGNELGSGSIRITDPALQGTIFRLLGIPADEQQRRFGFLLDGLASGAPPHGGFALGFDRIAMLLAGAPSLRDVIAFPKTTAARALFEDAPTRVKPADLAALHLTSLAEPTGA